MKTQILSIITLLLIVGAATAQEKRNPLLWPFSKTSIWNMPVHKDAVLVPANIQAKNAWSIGPTEDEDVIILTPDEPLIDMYKQGWGSNQRCVNLGSYPTKLPVPASLIVKKGGTPNHSAAILMPDGETFYQTQPFDKCSQGSVAYSMYKYPSVSMYSDGIEGAHGGSGLSSIGGTVRLGEVVPGGEIKHAIKVNLYAKTDLYYRSNDPDGKPGYRWPAVKADGYANATSYAGTNPVLQMGSLLVLPPDFDIESLSTEPGKIFARAFMNYGGYVVDDTAWDVWAIPTEKGSEGSVLTEFANVWGYPFVNKDKNHPWSKDMQSILLALHVVDNNGPDNIGGGPTTDWENRRAPMAPDFIERPDSVTGVIVAPSEILLAIGANGQLTATISPDHVTNKNVTWSSGNESVATVNENGLVLAIAEGTTIITATTQQNNLMASCTVNVTKYGGHTPIPAKIEAEEYSDMKGVQTEPTTDEGGGLHVSNIGKDDWMEYKIHVPDADKYTVDLRMASPYSSRQIEILLDNNKVATVDVPNTGSWQTWQTVSTTINIDAGARILRVLSSVGGGNNLNLNWLEISTADETAAGSDLNVNPNNGIMVSPNPVRLGEPLKIQFEDNIQGYSLLIRDIAGKIVYSGSSDGITEFAINSRGTYFISVSTHDHTVIKAVKLVVI